MVFANYLEKVLFITKLLYLTCWLVLVRTRVLVFFKFTRSKVKLTWVTCDQLCKQFLLNILKTIDNKARRHLPHTYSLSHTMSVIPLLLHEPFFNRLLVHNNTHSIKNPFQQKVPGGHMCCSTFLVSNISLSHTECNFFKKWLTEYIIALLCDLCFQLASQRRRMPWNLFVWCLGRTL